MKGRSSGTGERGAWQEMEEMGWGDSFCYNDEGPQNPCSCWDSSVSKCICLGACIGFQCAGEADGRAVLVMIREVEVCVWGHIQKALLG